MQQLAKISVTANTCTVSNGKNLFVMVLVGVCGDWATIQRLMTIVWAGVSGFDLLGLGEKCKKRAFSPEVTVWGLNLKLNPSGKRSHNFI